MNYIIWLIISMSNVLANAPTQKERDGILEFHTRLRETVSPTAGNMMMMNYSLEMENLAIKWVKRCRFEHPSSTTDSVYAGYGQNLALIGGYLPNLTQMAQGWYNEISDYTYANNYCRGVCGHYTQMVWARSVGLGCAMKQCDHIKPDWPKPVFLMACQYAPA
uniref:SCP domain-containing protein n=1 Tax=Mesocestoides corti TaxID=53468 RepID=A0A5K3F4P6_MESCO